MFSLSHSDRRYLRLAVVGVCTLALLFFLSSCSCGKKRNLAEGLYAEIKTKKGSILVRLEAEKAPLTVASFVGLAEGTKDHTREESKKFYDGLTFHRVIDKFMVQAGCPLGTGNGSPGYSFIDEIHPELFHDKAGVLSMANNGRNSNGSQFFITHAATPWLDRKHTIFGQVVDPHSYKVVSNITKGDVIKTIKIIRKGEKFADYQVSEESYRQAFVEALQTRSVREQQQKEEALRTVALINDEAERTESGLQYVILQKGNGVKKPETSHSAKVAYRGMLTNGEVFDQNSEARFFIEGVIKGFAETLEMMEVGEKRVVKIPPALAYGENGQGNAIPPNSDLIFEIEVLEFLQ